MSTPYEETINLVGSLEEARRILNGAPKFILEAIDQEETLYNIRLEKYVERGISRALIQLDDGEEYTYSTMPYHSSFYAECVSLSDLRTALKKLTTP